MSGRIPGSVYATVFKIMVSPFCMMMMMMMMMMLTEKKNVASDPKLPKNLVPGYDWCHDLSWVNPPWTKGEQTWQFFDEPEGYPKNT